MKLQFGRFSLFALTVLIASLMLALPVAASTTTVDFEAYTTGTVDNQDGWNSDGASGFGCAVYDHQVVNNTYGYTSFGTKSLRVSNAVTSGCFSDQTFSKSVTDEAGETSAQSNGFSGGTRQSTFSAQWDFASTVPNAEQAGLSVVASPDRGDGARINWLEMMDTPSGLRVNFADYQRTRDPSCATDAGFVTTNVANSLDRTRPHTLKLVTTFVDGPANDIVQVYVDGVLKHTGTSWEDYFRDCEGNPTRTVDSLLFRTSGTAAPGTAGNGFLIDNITLISSTPPPNSGSLKVTKYDDVNRSGKRDSGEPGLAGWTITVKQGTTTVASDTTNANGEVTFTLLPGNYTVCETQQPNWQNTDPKDGSGCKSVSVKNSSTSNVVLGNASAPANPAPAQPGKIYAVNDGGTADSQLFTVNIASPNTVTALGPLYKGYDLEALDIDPLTGVIYVSSGSDNKFNQKGYLYKVDSTTGALTPVGSTGQKQVAALAFRSNGELWGWGDGKGLITINKATGASTLVYKDSKSVEGLAFSSDGSKLYASVGKKLYEYTIATAKLVEFASNLPGMTEALDLRPDGKLLLGVDGSTVIYVYDLVTKQVTAEKISVNPYNDVEGIGYSAP